MFRDVFKKQPVAVFMTDICLTDRKLLSTVLASQCIILSILIVWFIGPLNVIPVTPVVITSSMWIRSISSMGYNQMQPKYDAGVHVKQILKNTENIATSLTELSSLLLQCHSCYRFRRNRNMNDSNRNDNYHVQPPSKIRHPHCRRLNSECHR